MSLNQTRQLAQSKSPWQRLLIEVMVIDGNLDDQELESITGTLSSMLETTKEQVDELIALSREEVTEATSLYQFTREINDHFDEQKKLELMTGMWRVAYADGHLDKHEESIMRRVADLLHILHSDYIRCKINAQRTGMLSHLSTPSALIKSLNSC